MTHRAALYVCHSKRDVCFERRTHFRKACNIDPRTSRRRENRDVILTVVAIGRQVLGVCNTRIIHVTHRNCARQHIYSYIYRKSRLKSRAQVLLSRRDERSAFPISVLTSFNLILIQRLVCILRRRRKSYLLHRRLLKDLAASAQRHPHLRNMVRCNGWSEAVGIADGTRRHLRSKMRHISVQRYIAKLHIIQRTACQSLYKDQPAKKTRIKTILDLSHLYRMLQASLDQAPARAHGS